MELIYISNTRLPTEKARGLQIMKSCEAFAEHGTSVTLIAPDVLNPLSEDPFSYYSVKKNFKLERRFCFHVLTRAASEISEKLAFYAHSISFALAAVLPLGFLEGEEPIVYSREVFSLFLLSLLGFRPVAEVHNFRGTYRQWHLQFIFDRARAIIVNAPGTREMMLRHYEIAPEKILVAQNGVDPGFFDIAIPAEEARISLGLPQQGHVIAYIGRLETAGQEKGIEELLQAFKKIRLSHSNTTLCIVGGPQEYVERYQAQAGEGVLFAGQVPFQKIPLYLRAVDIVTIPFPDTQQYQTSSPIKLFEYMAAGKTIVAADLAALRICLNEKNAVFFKPGDAEDMVRALEDVLSDNAHAQALGTQAREDSKRYSWSSRAQNILTFIRHQ